MCTELNWLLDWLKGRGDERRVHIDVLSKKEIKTHGQNIDEITQVTALNMQWNIYKLITASVDDSTISWGKKSISSLYHMRSIREKKSDPGSRSKKMRIRPNSEQLLQLK